MNINEETLRAVTREVCLTTLGLTLRDEPNSAITGGDDWLATEIHIDGGWTSKISVVMSKNLACVMAGRMFDQEPNEVELCDVEDSLREFVNIVGGNLKGIVGVDSTLSIPEITAVRDFDAEHLATAYECESERLHVVVEEMAPAVTQG